jgi:C_GCAxxG_C_C family probable redox protein
LIPRIATAFCSGLSHTAGQCGAVNGGILAISLMAGRDDYETPVDDCYTAIQRFLEAFQTQHNSLTCPGLLGINIAEPEGLEKFHAHGMVETCYGLVELTTQLALESLTSRRTAWKL